MKHHIKYEKLSSEIKKEIGEFHKFELKYSPGMTIDEAMHKWFDEKFDLWLTNKLENDNKNRKHYRLNVEIPVKIVDTLLESSQDDSSAFDFIARTVNISKGGLYFKYTRKIEISSIIKIMIDLSNIDKDLMKIEALAMVVRNDDLGKDQYGIGVMFSSIYENDSLNLNIFILKNLSYHLYSNQ